MSFHREHEVEVALTSEFDIFSVNFPVLCREWVKLGARECFVGGNNSSFLVCRLITGNGLSFFAFGWFHVGKCLVTD